MSQRQSKGIGSSSADRAAIVLDEAAELALHLQQTTQALQSRTAIETPMPAEIPESVVREATAAAKRMAQVNAYSRALFSLKDAHAIRVATAECVTSVLRTDIAHVFLARAETEEATILSVFETGRPRMRNLLSHENELTVGVLGAHGTIAVIRTLNKSDWTDFSDEDLRILESIATHLGLKLENLRLENELKSQLQSSIQALAQAIEMKDRYTGGHTKRVFAYADAIASQLPLTEEERERVRLAGLLHDIGKIGVPDRILQKPSELTAAEWTEMERHTDWGYDIVSRVEGLENIAEILRFHHERWDGNGYPTGLKGTEIPRASRVITIADAFDAMVTERPYRKAMSPEDARIRILSLAGTQFDPEMVQAFDAAFEKLAALARQAAPGIS